MMGLISCYSEFAVQLSVKSSCSNYKNVSNSVSPNLTPSIQTAVTYLYKTTLTTGADHLITVTWCRNAATQFFEINSGADISAAFRLNTNSRLFKKKKGNKTFEINNSKFEVFYDLLSAQYAAAAAEPIGGYYVLIMVDSELGLFLGDMAAETAAAVKKIAKFYLVSRQEYIYGNTLYSTTAQFSGTGACRDILITCTGDDDGGLKNPILSVFIDKQVVIRVKRLRWNFRGNQTIFVDGLSVDVMWDVHDWFFKNRYGSGSVNGSGHAVFLFRTRNGSDSRLWLEDKVKKKDDEKEFSLLIYGTKS